MAVVTRDSAIAAEPIEEVAVAEDIPQPTKYEVLRANAIAKQERASEEKLERVLDYIKRTMVSYMRESRS